MVVRQGGLLNRRAATEDWGRSGREEDTLTCIRGEKETGERIGSFKIENGRA
jgi:hypothetical protein